MSRLFLFFGAVALIAGFVAPPNAAAQQSVSFYIGGFTPRVIDARSDDEVIVQNGTFLSTANRTRGIDVGQFNNVTVGGEWFFVLTSNLEGGLGLGFYQRSVPTFYTDLVNIDSTDIEQNLKLRIVPLTATVRLLPFGQDAAIQPYIGAGVGVYRWRYSETGEFVDFEDNVFSGTFVGSGTEAGPMIIVGVRLPIASAGVSFEVRYQSAEGTLPVDKGFAGSTIGLGGLNYLLIMNF